MRIEVRLLRKRGACMSAVTRFNMFPYITGEGDQRGAELSPELIEWMTPSDLGWALTDGMLIPRHYLREALKALRLKWPDNKLGYQTVSESERLLDLSLQHQRQTGYQVQASHEFWTVVCDAINTEWDRVHARISAGGQWADLQSSTEAIDGDQVV